MVAPLHRQEPSEADGAATAGALGLAALALAAAGVVAVRVASSFTGIVTVSATGLDAAAATCKYQTKLLGHGGVGGGVHWLGVRVKFEFSV